MLHPIYKCDDYDFNDGLLTIYNAELVGQVRDITRWSVIEEHVGVYDAMICPSMYKDHNDNTASTVIFK